MLKTKHLLIWLIPAIIIGIAALFIRAIQYEPVFSQKIINQTPAGQDFVIPIFFNDPLIGDSQAPVTLIAFMDLEHGSCKQQFSRLEQLLKNYPEKIKIIWKGLALAQSPYPTKLAHQYSYCAAEQGKFIDFIRLAFANNSGLSSPVVANMAENAGLDKKKLSSCLASKAADGYLQVNSQLAQFLNIQSVPTLFLNNKQAEAPKDLEGWKSLLNL